MANEDRWYDRWIDRHAREDALLTELRQENKTGRIDIVPCAFGWYWHAFVGDTRVNGGLSEVSSHEASRDARWAIDAYRASSTNHARRAYLKEHYWDEETQQWMKHGELPAL